MPRYQVAGMIAPAVLAPICAVAACYEIARPILNRPDRHVGLDNTMED